MKFLKTVAVSLSVVLLAGCLGGCGNDAKTGNAQTQSQVDSKVEESVVPTETEPESEAMADYSNVQGAELKVHFHANNKNTLMDGDGKLLPVYQLACDTTGINVDITSNPVAQNSLQEFELQATQKFPADIYGATNIRQAVQSYGAQGAFMPLNDLIDEYAPNIKAFFEENPEIRKSLTAADGNIYFLAYCPDGDVARTYFIRTDWLDALDLSMPKTFEELETALYAFRNDDPNDNGKKDEVPVFNDKWEEAIRLANLWGARVYAFDSFSERVVLNQDNEMYHAWTAPEFKDALKQLGRWYKDGILDNELFTRKSNTARQTLWTKDNVGGMTHEFFASTGAYNYNEELLTAVPDFHIASMLPVSAVGDPFEEHQRATAKNDGWAISHSCSNPEAAIRYMDWFYSEEGNRAINFGIEGDSYTMVDGLPVFTDTVLSQTNVNTYIQTQFGAQICVGYKQNFDYEEQWLTPEAKEAYEMYKDSGLYTRVANPVLSFTEEEQAIYDDYITSVNTYQDEMITGFITNKYDVDTEWDAYVNQCTELGSEKLVEIYSQAYERYMNME